MNKMMCGSISGTVCSAPEKIEINGGTIITQFLLHGDDGIWVVHCPKTIGDFALSLEQGDEITVYGEIIADNWSLKIMSSAIKQKEV